MFSHQYRCHVRLVLKNVSDIFGGLEDRKRRIVNLPLKFNLRQTTQSSPLSIQFRSEQMIIMRITDLFESILQWFMPLYELHIA